MRITLISKNFTTNLQIAYDVVFSDREIIDAVTAVGSRITFSMQLIRSL